MFINNFTYFDNGTKTSKVKTLLFEYDAACVEGNEGAKHDRYLKIQERMQSRVKDHYFAPLSAIVKQLNGTEYKENFGFIIMGINCILIELYYEMVNGYGQSSDGGSTVDAYVYVLSEKIGIDKDLATRFYRGIRCGIVHQGQTKEKTAITFQIETIIEPNGDLFICNPKTLYKSLSVLYKDYWEKTSGCNVNDELAQNLILKVKKIIDEVPETSA